MATSGLMCVLVTLTTGSVCLSTWAIISGDHGQLSPRVRQLRPDILLLGFLSFLWSLVYMAGLLWRTEDVPLLYKTHIPQKDCLLEVQSTDTCTKNCHFSQEQRKQQESSRLCSGFLSHLLLILVNVLCIDRFLRHLIFTYGAPELGEDSTLTAGLVFILPLCVIFVNVSLAVIFLLEHLITQQNRYSIYEETNGEFFYQRPTARYL